MIKKEDPLGIPEYGIQYLKMPLGHEDFQSALKEFNEINQFIYRVASNNTIPEFQGIQKRLQFINYGSTQLVYVLTIDESRQYTFIVNQPATLLGTGKKEFDNLKMLSKNNKNNVVTPIYYFVDNNNLNREMYITPYYYQSRCIGVEYRDWGAWIPEPDYHFSEFKDQDRKIINASMIALLIKLYNSKEKKGLSKIRLDGGDFMLKKGYENAEINYENILKNMKLVAARDLETMELDEYISRLRQELSGEINDNSKMKIIGKKLRKPIKLDEIEDGIKLGLNLREKVKNDQIK